MKEYTKIKTIFERNPETKFKTLLEGKYSKPEFKYLENNNWIFTEKVDGTNIRIMWDGENITYGGKTDNAQIPSFLVSRLVELFDGNNKLKFKESFPDGCCLYGEGYGEKIQSGGNYIKDRRVDFVLFDVKVNEWWLERKNIEDVAKKFNIEIVPIVGEGTLRDMVAKVKNGFFSEWGDFNAEGIVAKPEIDMFNRKGERIITKLKYKDFKDKKVEEE